MGFNSGFKGLKFHQHAASQIPIHSSLKIFLPWVWPRWSTGKRISGGELHWLWFIISIKPFIKWKLKCRYWRQVITLCVTVSWLETFLAFELMSVEGTMGLVISALVSLSQRKQQNSMHLGCNLRRSVNTLKSLQIHQEYLFVLDIF